MLFRLHVVNQRIQTPTVLATKGTGKASCFHVFVAIWLVLHRGSQCLHYGCRKHGGGRDMKGKEGEKKGRGEKNDCCSAIPDMKQWKLLKIPTLEPLTKPQA